MDQQFDYFIFDLDGTLLDSMWAWNCLGSRYLRANGIEPPANVEERLKVMSAREAAGFFARDFMPDRTQDEIAQGIHAMIEDAYRNQVMPKPGVLDMLGRLRCRGAHMCIATATDRYLVEMALGRLNMMEYFDFILTCTEVGIGKEHPQIYLTAAEKWGIQPAKAVVVEDALHAAETAKRAGFFVLGIYDKSAREDEPAMRALCDRYIESFEVWGDR